ncbi:hypothetical protein X734_31645 [Mesorhizobium sp. L2C084A000]|nr:hypothetical protein X734_31645 [Mesorhizobium sp. L2C084A000]
MIASIPAATLASTLACRCQRDSAKGLDDPSCSLAVALDMRVLTARVEQVDCLGEAIGAIGVAGRERHAVVVIEVIRCAAAQCQNDAKADRQVPLHGP